MMKTLLATIGAISFMIASPAHADHENLLTGGFAAVAVSTESIEALYVDSSELSYVPYFSTLGADWDSDGTNINSFFAGLNLIEEPTILFLANDPVDSIQDIAFENVSKKSQFKLAKWEIVEINEDLMFSRIKARSIDPKEFDTE